MNVRRQLVCGPIGGRISDKIELQSNSYSQPGRTYLILPSKLYSLYNCAGIPKQRGHSSSPSHALYTAPTSSVINGILYYFMLPYESRQICLVRFISTLNYFTTICILPRPPTDGNVLFPVVCVCTFVIVQHYGISQLLIHLSTHPCHHHHSQHPSLVHSFIPDSKHTSSTNPSHLNFTSLLVGLPAW